MTRIRTVFSLTLMAAGAALLACGSEPQIKVQVAEATPAASPALTPVTPITQMPQMPQMTQMPPAMPAGAGAEGMALPPSHPPLGGPIQSAPPLSPGAQMPADHPPLGGPAPAGMQLAPVDPSLGTGEKGIAWSAPAGWESVPPANTMRRAQYRVPGKGGDAECAIFYFGPGQGGDPQSNAERWASQFVLPDGRPGTATMKVRETVANGIKVLFVETSGTYLAGSMTGMQGQPVPGQALLGAVAEGPDANWFFKMTGPEATVEAQRGAFEKMVSSLRKGS